MLLVDFNYHPTILDYHRKLIGGDQNIAKRKCIRGHFDFPKRTKEQNKRFLFSADRKVGDVKQNGVKQTGGVDDC